MVVCEYVFGMYARVIASSLNTVGASGLRRPRRRGITGAKKLTSEPVTGPWYVPAPAITSSLKSVSEPMRIRCCRSATSGVACAFPCAGFTRLKMAPVTVSMMAADTSSSISE